MPYFVVVLALHSTLFWIGHHPAPRLLVGDETMYRDGGERLAAGETWAYESLWPPLQPIVLSLVLAATGHSLWAVEVVQTAMLVAVAWLLGDLTRELTGSRLAAVVAGGLVLLDPQLVAFAHFLWPEALHMLLVVGVLWILVRRPPSRSWVFAAGVLLGLALCSKYLLWPFVAVALPVVLVTRRPALDRTVFFAIGLILGPGIVYTSPRLAMNGTPVVDSAAFNLWVGLQERSRKDLVDSVVGKGFARYVSSPSIRERDELMWGEIGALIRQRGILRLLAEQAGRQYFRLFDKDSFLTEQLPGGVFAVIGGGYQETPLAVARSLRIWSYVLYAAVLASSVLGAVVFPERGRRWSRCFLAFLGYALLVFLVSHVKSRFRVQLLPFLFVYSGCAVAWVASRLGRNVEEAVSWRHGPTRGSLLAAALGAALLLFLAFGRSLV